MQVKETAFRRVNLLEVNGRVDSETVARLDEAFKSLEKQGRNRLVVDLHQVDYLSSAGLRSLVGARRVARSHGGDVRLATPSARVQEVLSLAGLTNLFETYPDVTAAVGSF